MSTFDQRGQRVMYQYNTAGDINFGAVHDRINFSMDTSMQDGACGWIEACCSKTLLLFHGVVAGTIVLVMLLLPIAK